MSNLHSTRATVARGAIFAAGIALLVAMGDAQAAVSSPTAPDATSAKMARCSRLPLSQSEFCKSEVGWSAIAASQAAIDRSASSRTASAMVACETVPLSQRGICKAQAGYGQPVPKPALSVAQEIALNAADARYRAAAADCSHMPLSDRTMCLSQAGNDTRLSVAG
jgi:hypothetical protein